MKRGFPVPVPSLKRLGAVVAGAAIALGALPCPAQQPDPPAPQERQERKERDLTELSLEELMKIEVHEVYSASRHIQKIMDAPATVTVVTAEEIRTHGYRTLADVLRSIRGVTVTYDRNYSYVGVRGFGLPTDYNNRLLFLVDGHRMNDAIYDGVLFGGEFVLDVDTIERLEFVRGPAASLYGSNAFFGVVSITTKRGRQIDGVESSASAGSFGSYKGRVSGGKLFENGVEALVSASIYDSEGQTLHYKEFDPPAASSGFTEKADGEYYVNTFGSLSWKGLTLEGGYVVREKRVPTASYLTFYPSRHTVTWDNRGYVDLKLDHEFEDKLHVQARVFMDSYWYHANYEYQDLLGNLFTNKDLAVGMSWGAEATASKSLLQDRLKLTLGAELRDNFRQDQRNYDDVAPRVDHLDSRVDSVAVGVFAQADAALLDTLRLNAGLRFDHYDTFGGTVNPRAALIWSPFEQTAFKLLYGRAFRAPSAYELHYDDGGILQKASPGLDPETIDTYEVAWEQGLGAGFQLSASLFHYEVRDLITLTLDPSDGLFFFDNVDRVRATGGELELTARRPDGLEGRLSFSTQIAEDVSTGSWLPNSPKLLLKLNLTYPVVAERLFTGVEIEYVGRRTSLGRNEIDDYVIANLTIFSRELAKGLEVSASVYNLFDKRYFDPGGREHVQDQIEQDGISFRLKLTYRF